MEIPEALVEALRAHINSDEDTHAEILQPFAETQHAGYPLLIMAAFHEAAELYFKESRTLSDVIRYVGQVRARSNPNVLDPTTAEKSLLATLGDANARATLDLEDHISMQMDLLPVLVYDNGLRGADLDSFLARSRTRAQNVTITA